MEERPKLGKTVTIKTHRKHGNGAKGGGRQGGSGKKAEISQTKADGTTVIVYTAEKPTFRELSRNLHGPGGVPQHVSINKNGETHF